MRVCEIHDRNIVKKLTLGNMDWKIGPQQHTILVPICTMFHITERKLFSVLFSIGSVTNV